MKLYKFLLRALIVIMFLGGVMGLIKGVAPEVNWLGFRHLLGMGGTFGNENTPAYAVIYGICLAVLEIASSILLFVKSRAGINFSIVTLSVSALGCIAALLLGDIFSICSLLVRLFAIHILFKAKRFCPNLGKQATNC